MIFVFENFVCVIEDKKLEKAWKKYHENKVKTLEWVSSEGNQKRYENYKNKIKK